MADPLAGKRKVQIADGLFKGYSTLIDIELLKQFKCSCCIEEHLRVIIVSTFYDLGFKKLAKIAQKINLDVRENLENILKQNENDIIWVDEGTEVDSDEEMAENLEKIMLS